MKTRTKSGLTVTEQYIADHPGDQEWYQRALRVLPTGITHDARFLEPFPFYIVRAQGSRKWDVNGNEYVDYAMGHGALMLGHQHPTIVAAVEEQFRKGTHYGASHPLEVEWAELITSLVPSAEKVRFTSSGTEATMMAMRLARAYTGKGKILKFQGHFHGWHDFAILGERPPFNLWPSGINEVLDQAVIVAPTDIEAVRTILEADGDTAGVILEPTGATFSRVPLPEGFLPQLRELTKEYGVLLIFDEVVTGFRWAPGGVQEVTGVIPDLTTLAKIMAGGLPGGAVAGNCEVMEFLEFKDDEWNRRRKIFHPGTFNANPLSAAAGIAALKILSDPQMQEKAAAQAAKIRRGINEILVREEVDGCAYGESSVFHILLGVPCQEQKGDDLRDPRLPAQVLKGGTHHHLAQTFELGMLEGGAHIFHMAGLVSCVHSDDDVEKTLKAFRRTIVRLQEEGLLT
ncbi:MAG: aspartate aminotransferase family protein [Anaerolineae bacterium]